MNGGFMQELRTFQDRLVFVMKNKKLKQIDLVRTLNISKGTASNWYSGKTAPENPEQLAKLANFLGTSIGWLATGQGEIISANVGDNITHGSYDNAHLVKKQQKKAHVLNWVQAGSFTDIGSNSYDEYLTYFGDYGDDRVYWLCISGNSMHPDFKEGEYILINTDRQPAAGNFVAALQYGEEKATFKKYRPKGFDDKGVEYWHLVPSNSEYPIIDSRYQPFEVLGVAVERNQSLV